MASVNPFEIKKEKIEDGFKELDRLSFAPYADLENNPCARMWILFMNAVEISSVLLKHFLISECACQDLRREMALLSRADQFQQKGVTVSLTSPQPLIEQAVLYEQLNTELGAVLAQNETDRYVKAALDFALIEDVDHLYRFSNLLKLESDVKAEIFTGGITEIMPARPTISQHRHPFDDVKHTVPSEISGLKTRLNIAAVTAAKRQTLNFFMNAGALYGSDAARRLFAEIALTEEQHLTQYDSLADPALSITEKLLMCEYTECYLYYSAYLDEKDEKLKNAWERRFIREAAHLKKAAELMKTYENKDYAQLIPQENFPEKLSFNEFTEANKNYIRKVLKETADNTALLEDYVKVGELPQNCAFFKYNGLLTRPYEAVASHFVIKNLIERDGCDYRFETSPHPLPAMRERAFDNIEVGR